MVVVAGHREHVRQAPAYRYWAADQVQFVGRGSGVDGGGVDRCVDSDGAWLVGG